MNGAKVPEPRLNGDHLTACPTESYDDLLDAKVSTLSSLIPSFPKDKIEVFRSPKEHYRMRANFIVWRDNKRDNSASSLFYGMYESPAADTATAGTAGLTKKQRKIAKAKLAKLNKVPTEKSKIHEIKNFPRGTKLIDNLMQKIMLYLKGLEDIENSGIDNGTNDERELLRKDIFEIRLVTTQTNEAIVVLLYHCQLDTIKWCNAANGLLKYLQNPLTNTGIAINENDGIGTGAGALKIIARARKQKLYITPTNSSVLDLDSTNKNKNTTGQGQGQGQGQTNNNEPKVSLENLQKELITEKYNVDGVDYINYQIEGAFSQPNASVCQHMLRWSQECTGTDYNHEDSTSTTVVNDNANFEIETKNVNTEDLVELYCGGGTFTAPLAKNFRSVLATELSKASVILAKKSFSDMNISNITIAPMSAEDFSDMYVKHINTVNNNKKQKSNDGASTTTSNTNNNTSTIRSNATITNLNQFDNISTAFVDPPRAGCDEDTCALLAKFDKICYISCNPETLARDINRITSQVSTGTSTATTNGSSSGSVYRHRVVRMAAFDQFPYTHHLEGGVMLVKMREDADDATDKTSTVGEKRKAEADA
jgi:tRNA (uracil-5-)-methyltransferase